MRTRIDMAGEDLLFGEVASQSVNNPFLKNLIPFLNFLADYWFIIIPLLLVVSFILRIKYKKWKIK